METGQIILSLAILLLVVCSGFFSASETAYTGANKVRLTTLANDGNKKAKRMLALMDKYDKLLTTILIGNNIVNILMTSLSTILFIDLLKDQNLAAIVSTAVITVVVLIFGEITPKSIAKEKPESVGMATCGILRILLVVLTPLNVLFSLWKKLVIVVFRLKTNNTITDEELITYVETAASEGAIEAHESQLIKSAIEFEDVDVADIMIPRVNVIAVEDTFSTEDIKKAFLEHGFSRMPIYKKTIDCIIGIVHQKDFYEECLTDKKSLADILQNSICVSNNMKISVVLRMLQKAKVHMAVVVDEFGGTSGIVTMEDILEELVGEIYDEHDEEEVFLRKVDKDTFISAGEENLEHLLETLEIKTKQEFDSTTVGGFVTELLGKIPTINETVSYENLDFTVTKANAKRVLEVRVKVGEKDVDDGSNAT